jgi:hypothetical protein
MAKPKIIRAVYKEYIDRNICVSFRDWYADKDKKIAKVDLDNTINKPDSKEKGEFIGWEEKILETE